MGALGVLTLFKTFIQCYISVEKLFKIIKNFKHTENTTATLNRCHFPCLVQLFSLILALYKQHSVDTSKFLPSFSLLKRRHFAEIVNFFTNSDVIDIMNV